MKHSNPIRNAVIAAALLLTTGTFFSCSEDKIETIEEYPNWKSTNEAYWSKLYNETKQKIDAGDTSWKIILNYTYQNQTNPSGTPPTYRPDQYIIVHELEKGTGAGTPLYTDSVHIHYRGRLLPSTTYTAGFITETSWDTDNFNPLTARPAQMRVSKTVDGFATALQNMHIGDHWMVYVPYRLGYGVRKNPRVPAYSTLIFDLRLVSFYKL